MKLLNCIASRKVIFHLESPQKATQSEKGNYRKGTCGKLPLFCYRDHHHHIRPSTQSCFL